MMLILHLSVLRGSQNKQQLLPYTALRDWFLKPTWSVFTARYALSPYIKQTRFFFKGLSSFPVFAIICCSFYKSWSCGCAQCLDPSAH
jgi:hypothetical protein